MTTAIKRARSQLEVEFRVYLDGDLQDAYTTLEDASEAVSEIKAEAKTATDLAGISEFVADLDPSNRIGT
jgi:hypothetical protein